MDRPNFLVALSVLPLVLVLGCAVGGPGSTLGASSGKADSTGEVGESGVDPVLLPFPLVTDLRATPRLLSIALGGGSSLGADNAVYRLVDADCDGICEDDPASCAPCREGGFMVPLGAAHPLPTDLVGHVAVDARPEAPFGEAGAGDGLDSADPESAREGQMLFLIDRESFAPLSLEMPTPDGGSELVDVFRRIVVRGGGELELLSKNPADPEGPLLSRILASDVSRYAVLVGPPADFTTPAPGAESGYRYDLATTCIVPAEEVGGYEEGEVPAEVDAAASCFARSR